MLETLKNISVDATSLLAQGYVPLVRLPFLNPDGTPASFTEFINALYNIVIGLGALAGVFIFVYAGFIYVTGEKVSSKSNAKEMMTNVIIGLLLLLGTYLIFQEINPDILRLEIGAPSSSSPGGSSSPTGSPGT